MHVVVVVFELKRSDVCPLNWKNHHQYHQHNHRQYHHQHHPEDHQFQQVINNIIINNIIINNNSTRLYFQDFENAYKQAKLATQDRNMRVAAVVESLERDLELLCLTGVEDKLQDQVRPTLELLRNAGIRIWMLTGKCYQFAV